MSSNRYASADREVADYSLWRPSGVDLWLRGPEPDLTTPYVTFIGAAQTFGRFVERPFPSLVGEVLGVPALNLGVGGAGPGFLPQRYPGLLDLVEPGLATVVQIMSARSVDNSLFTSRGQAELVRRSDGRAAPAAQQYQDLLDAGDRQRVIEVVAETRRHWIGQMTELLEMLPRPTVLLWIARRQPHYRESYRSVWRLFGGFPQLVNRQMVDAVKHLADRYLECVTDVGMPQPLVSRRDGRAVTVEKPDGTMIAVNSYYPSPEMHAVAAEKLLATAYDLLSPEASPTLDP